MGPNLTYTVSMSGGSAGTFTITNGGFPGQGTYTYTLYPDGSTARLRLDYSNYPGDYDDITLFFAPQGAGGVSSFTGTQRVSQVQFPFTGTFTTSGSAIVSSYYSSVLVPGFRPGEQAPLTIKAWVGADYDSATVKQSWDFTSLPLGGPQGQHSRARLDWLGRLNWPGIRVGRRARAERRRRYHSCHPNDRHSNFHAPSKRFRSCRRHTPNR
jgi:hypothetical protein